ncbi:TPA: hypothetical protein ACPH2G_004595 [Pseudomonas aeruginosa]
MPDMREEFEAWVWDIYEETLWFDMNRESVLKRNGGEYFGNFLNDRWQAWKASRAALRVELPDKAKFVEYYEDLEGGTFNWQRYMVAIQEALQKAGIEVSP